MARFRVHHINLKLLLQVITCFSAGVILCLMTQSNIYFSPDPNSLPQCTYPEPKNRTSREVDPEITSHGSESFQIPEKADVTLATDDYISNLNENENAIVDTTLTGDFDNVDVYVEAQYDPDTRQMVLEGKEIEQSNRSPMESEKPELIPGTPGAAFSLNVTNGLINEFNVSLPELLPNYRNPCWIEHVPEDVDFLRSYFAECLFVKSKIHERIPKMGIRRDFSDMQETVNARRQLGHGWRIRCFPYLFILGVAKSGTTALFHSMEEYVHHFVPATLKELHFWEYKREATFGLKNDCGHDRKPKFAEYLDMFDNAGESIRTSTQKRNGEEYHPYFTADATPTTLTNDFNWKTRPGNIGLTEPKYITAHYLHKLAPNNLFIVIMRDPVDRLFSNFRMKLQYNKERNISRFSADMFPNLVKEGIAQFQNCTSLMNIRACVYKDQGFDFYHIMIKSFYHIFIRDWLEVYPREQILFLRMEDYKTKRLETMKSVVSFLKSETLTAAEENKLEQEQKELLESEKNKQILVMDEESQKLLQDFYRPQNKELVKLLIDEKYDWGY